MLCLTDVYRTKILEFSMFDIGRLTLFVHWAVSSAHDGFGRDGGLKAALKAPFCVWWIKQIAILLTKDHTLQH